MVIPILKQRYQRKDKYFANFGAVVIIKGKRSH